MEREPIFVVEELWIAMDRKRRIKRMTWRDVAKEVGLSASTFSRMSLDDRPPSVDALCRMLVWLGDTELKPYLRPIAEPASPQPRKERESWLRYLKAPTQPLNQSTNCGPGWNASGHGTRLAPR